MTGWKNFGAGEFFSSDEEILENVKKWRAANPKVVQFWYGVETAAKAAVLHPGAVKKFRDIQFWKNPEGRDLCCVLPSGRAIRYLDPELRPGITSWGETRMQLHFHTSDKHGNWVRKSTYGGKLTENIVQGVARDILANALVALEKAGYPVVFHVHDEIITEVPQGWGSVEEMERIMSQMPSWAHDWPIKANGGWRGLRYRKD